MGGSTESKTKNEPPAWWSKAAQEALAQAEKASKIGYVPYMGPDVAALNPQMIQGMQQAADWSAAFDTPGVAAPSVAASIPAPTDFGGGIQGYSSYPMFQDALAAFEKAYPGQAAYIRSFFVNPQTGPAAPATPTNPWGSRQPVRTRPADNLNRFRFMRNPFGASEGNG